jgi:hypothetical protein
MLLELMTLSIAGGFVWWNALRPLPQKRPAEKLGDALTGYFRSLRQKGA